MATSDSDCERETFLKKEKARAKSNCTRARNKLVSLLEDPEGSSRCEVLDAVQNLDRVVEITLDVIGNMADFYTEQRNNGKCQKTVQEMDIVQEEYSAASDLAKDYLVSLRDDRSSLTSNSLAIDFGDMLDISKRNGSEKSSDTIKVRGNCSSVCSPVISPASASEISSNVSDGNLERSPLSVKRFENMSSPNENKQSTKVENREASRYVNIVNKSGIKQELNPNAPSFQGFAKSCNYSIGQDLWQQLKRVSIPVFSGDKHSYQSWKAAFLACIDSAPATGEYKLLQLRQYLSGEALRAIENLGHSSAAYEAAKDRLERKFGGRRRQIAVYLEELDQFKQVRLNNSKDLEKFADLLDIALINLKEAGQSHELGNGTLYTKLQRKLPEAMLARYHRWVFENGVQDSVSSLRTWTIQESEFHTMASETVYGISRYREPDQAANARYRSHRTHFGDAEIICLLCNGSHALYDCRQFLQKSVSDRWNFSKEKKLCYRCLEEGHFGKQCLESRKCWKNGCSRLHHELLHDSERIGRNTRESRSGRERNKYTEKRAIVTEGNNNTDWTTMMSQSQIAHDFIGLRTVPVIICNGNRSVKVNALLDDASTKTYLNEDVAAELGLQGRSEKVTVNVLNGQVETFETKPVEFGLQSLNGNVSIKVSAYTANKVTGNMNVVNWNLFKQVSGVVCNT